MSGSTPLVHCTVSVLYLNSHSMVCKVALFPRVMCAFYAMGWICHHEPPHILCSLLRLKLYSVPQFWTWVSCKCVPLLKIIFVISEPVTSNVSFVHGRRYVYFYARFAYQANHGVFIMHCGIYRTEFFHE